MILDKLKRMMIDDEKSIVKAAFYYMLCQFLVRGMGFITTPIFSRIMSQEEYGIVNNFLSWEGVLFPIVTLGLRGTINKSKYDYEKENDSYLTTIYCMAAFAILVAYVVIECSSEFFCDLFTMDIKYIRILFVYLLFYAAFDFQQIQYNIYRKYKVYVAYSICSSFFSVTLSVLFVLFFTDKVAGRLMGMVIPVCILGIIILLNMLYHGKPKKKYINYALNLGIPLIPSALSATILSASDRIIISKYCGFEQTALYSIPYTISSIAAILWSGLNQAWAPWMLDNFKSGDFSKVKKVSRVYGAIYVFIIIGLMLVAPEMLLILGGRTYYVALKAIPPVILGMIMQFFYAFYFDTEYFFGERYIISLGTGVAAGVNIVLNILFIPKYGYVAAAYTTFIGYLVMLVYHFCIVHFKIKKGFIFDSKAFGIIILLAIALQIGIINLYEHPYLRMFFVLIYLCVLVALTVRNKRYLIDFKNKILNRK